MKNLRLAQAVVELMNERGMAALRRQSGVGPEISELTLQCIREATV